MSHTTYPALSYPMDSVFEPRQNSYSFSEWLDGLNNHIETAYSLLDTHTEKTNWNAHGNVADALCTVDNLGLTSAVGDNFLLTSAETDGASNIAFTLAATNAMDTEGAKVISITSGGTEVFNIESIDTGAEGGDGAYTVTCPQYVRMGDHAGPKKSTQQPILGVSGDIKSNSTDGDGALHFIATEVGAATIPLVVGGSVQALLGTSFTGEHPVMKGVVGEIRNANSTIEFYDTVICAAVEGRLSSAVGSSNLGWAACLYGGKGYSGGKPEYAYGTYIENLQGTIYSYGGYIAKQTGGSTQNTGLNMAGSGLGADLYFNAKHSIRSDGTNLVIEADETGTGNLKITGGTSLGKELLQLDQNDADKPFIDFQGTVGANTTASISSYTTSGATTHHIHCELNGTKGWFAFSTNNPTA